MPYAPASQVEVQKTHAQRHPTGNQDSPYCSKDSQRMIHRIEADDGDSREGQKGRDAAHQARLTGLGIGAHGDVDDRHPADSGLDECLQGISVVAEDGQTQRRLASEGPESTGGIRDGDPGGSLHHPTAPFLQGSLERRKVLQRRHPPVADDDVGPPLQNRLDQPSDILPPILVVGVCVDDDVSTGSQRCLQPRQEGDGQPSILRQMNDVMHLQLPRHLDGAVGAAVVHHQILDLINARKRTGEITHRLGKGGFFVVARNLDDEFHLQVALFYHSSCVRQ